MFLLFQEHRPFELQFFTLIKLIYYAMSFFFFFKGLSSSGHVIVQSPFQNWIFQNKDWTFFEYPQNQTPLGIWQLPGDIETLDN